MATCETCRFWKFGYVQPDADVTKAGNFGACKRHSPLVTGGLHTPMSTIWPSVHKDDWCGEHQPKEQTNGTA